VNNAQAETILQLVRAALPAPVDLLVDAYSGAGAYALALLASGDARRVVAIESDWPAVESARWTATLREIDPATLRLERGRVEDVLPGLDLKPDIVLLDPPRAGCAPALLQHLLAAPVPRLIYVSCDPSTLARDIRALSSGYRLISAQPVDMFPQTYHVETVAVLDALPAPSEPPPRAGDAPDS
jgi:23S rRNA (uracil1939-C5)-methyltransferase